MANTPHDHVHRLIRSMTRAEKRYFKLYTSRHVVSGHSNHQTLFDAIAAMDCYDEPTLLKRFAGQAFVLRFPIAKRRLYESILSSLDAFHSDSSVDARLRRMLHQVDILHQRALYTDAARMLRSVRQLARQHDRQTILLDALDRERRLIERANYTVVEANAVDRITKEACVLRHELEQVDELWDLKSRSFLLMYREGHVRGQQQARSLKELSAHPLLKKPQDLLTPKALFLYHHVHSAIAFSQGDLPRCAEHLSHNHQLLLKEQQRFRDEPNLLFSVLSNRIYVLSRLGRVAESEALLKEFRMMPATLPEAPSPDLEVKVFATSASLEMAMLARQGDFGKAVTRSEALTERMDRFDAQLGPLRKSGLLFQLAYVHLGAGELDKALRYSHRQLGEGTVDENTELHRFGRLLNLLILLDLDKKDLLPYALRNAERHFSERGRDLPVERALLAHVHQRVKARTPASVREALVSLRDQLIELEKDQREQAVYDHFDPLAWVKARLTERSMASVVNERSVANTPGTERKGRRAA